MVRSVAAGVVREVRCAVRASGPHVRHLWQYNVISVAHDDGSFADYVHIKADSARVVVGERVDAGAPLCESGSVGFCPTPHLHLQLSESADDNALPVPFAFRADNDSSVVFMPRAGQRCNASGVAKDCT